MNIFCEEFMVSDVIETFCFQNISNARGGIVVWLGCRRKRVSVYFCPELMQPERQPRSLEPGMSGYQDGFSAEGFAGHLLIPGNPRSISFIAHLLQLLFVTESIHALPEAVVVIGVEFSIICEILER